MAKQEVKSLKDFVGGHENLHTALGKIKAMSGSGEQSKEAMHSAQYYRYKKKDAIILNGRVYIGTNYGIVEK